MVIKRALLESLQRTTKSILLLGPRQTGRSTLLSMLEPELTINLAWENEFLRYSSDPDLFTDQIYASNAKTVFVDEVQRIPGLLNSVQAILDQNKNQPKDRKKHRSIRFLLSGSSASKIKRGGANLLPGRVLVYSLKPLCAKELKYDLDLNWALRFGLLPEPYLERDENFVSKLLQSYSATYLKEEIQAEALTRNIQGFARFLSVLGKNSGQVIDFSKLANEAKVSRTTSLRFFEILEDTWIAEKITVFDQTKAEVIRHPKFYFFDPGVLNGLLNNFSASPDRMGMLLEHFIYSQLKNSSVAQDIPIQIQYFRTRNGAEVDFVVTLQEKVWAIEVKAGAIAPGDLSGLKIFREYYPGVHQCVAVSPREKTRRKDGILICDWVTLLQEMGL